MQDYQEEFIEFMVRSEVLTFGDFTTKSGRKTPYFVNTGRYRTGAQIQKLGEFYARSLVESGLAFDVLFGPAYKGIPLVVATAHTLAASFGRDVAYCFDRKEAKDHGEGGWFVGTQPADGMRVVIVDDVVTSGRSIREAAALVRQAARVELAGVVVAVDRMERGKTAKTTVAELRDELAAPVHAIVNIREVVDALHGRAVTTADGSEQVVVDDARKAAIEAYLREHAGQA